MNSQRVQDEISLMLYFETCLVDHHGTVDRRQMNDTDREIADQWATEGLIEFRRIPWKEIPDSSSRTHRVRFSDRAWQRAHAERRARAERYTETLEATDAIQ